MARRAGCANAGLQHGRKGRAHIDARLGRSHHVCSTGEAGFEIAFKGNGHMLMLEKNNQQIIDVAEKWLDTTLPSGSSQK